jgi:capsular exopolysaccharide synthesis family protein
VAARVKRRLPGSGAVDDLRRQVRVAPEGTSGVYAIIARSGSPRRAAALADAFAEAVVALRRQAAQAELQRAADSVRATLDRGRGARAAAPGGLALSPLDIRVLTTRLARLEVLRALRSGDEARVVARAQAPSTPASPRPVHDPILAAFVGLVLGLPLMLLAGRLDQRVRDESDVLALVPTTVLARIPDARSGRAGAGHDSPGLADAFDLLRMNLQLMRPRGEGLVAVVTSPADGDGKSTVVARLADSLASSGADVLATDFDLRHPTLHAWFDVPRAAGGGVRGALLGTTSPNGLARSAGQPRLQVMPAGEVGTPPSGSVGFGRVPDLIALLRRKAEYVLVDTGPVSSAAGAAAVAAAADGVILVVDLATVRRRQLVAARRQLADAHATLLGIVVNRAPARPGAERRPPAGRPRTTPGWPITHAFPAIGKLRLPS